MITAIISVVIMVNQYKTRATLTLAQQARDNLKVHSAVESAKEELIYRLSTSLVWLYGPRSDFLEAAQLPNDLNFYGTEFQYNELTVRITDVSGLVSVVPFNDTNWRSLLNAKGVTPVEHIIDSLKDWYDEDDFVRLNGAESRDYEQPNLPRNAMPQTKFELAMVKNMTEEGWNKIVPYITYAGSGQVNPTFVPNSVLAGFVGDYRAEQIIAQRAGKGVFQDLIDNDPDEASTYYPSNRLKIEIKGRINDSAYQESFVLIRKNGTKRMTQITERQLGYIWADEY